MYMYTIGDVSKKFKIPASTLRYYDRMGLFPDLKRSSGKRLFSDQDIAVLHVIECLKMSGLEIKDIANFMELCKQGSATYPERLNLFVKQAEAVRAEIERLERTLSMLSFKRWYYEQAIADGGEERIQAMLPNNLPEDVQKLYDHGRGII